MRSIIMVECPRRCGWSEPVGSLYALGPTLARVRADELRAEHETRCDLAPYAVPVDSELVDDLCQAARDWAERLDEATAQIRKAIQ